MGGRRPQQNEIKCPFFVKWTTTSITCEGIMRGARCTSLTFPNENTLSNFARENCCVYEPPCEIFRLLQKMYKKWP